jgi:hypothetical protein
LGVAVVVLGASLCKAIPDECVFADWFRGESSNGSGDAHYSCYYPIDEAGKWNDLAASGTPAIRGPLENMSLRLCRHAPRLLLLGLGVVRKGRGWYNGIVWKKQAEF